MPPRTLTLVILASLIALAPPVFAAEKKKPTKQATRTWKTVVDYVFKNGGEDSIKAPASRTLGYDSDEIFAKSLGLDADKSKDGREHDIFVIYEKDGGAASIPKEIVIGNMSVTDVGSNKKIDSYRIRISLDGAVIQGMHATGLAGHVIQRALPPDSKELLTVFKNESNLNLKELDFSKLTQ